jgi:MbtH protein
VTGEEGTEMSDPFETTDADFSVLRNEEDQHSLWPAFAPVPEGWSVVHGPGPREECLAYVRENWTDVRPRSVAEFITDQAA